MSETNSNTQAAESGGSPVSPSRVEAAAAMIVRIDQFVADIPKFPIVSRSAAQLAAASAVPPEFIEQSNVALIAEQALTRPGVDAGQNRDLVAFSIAYGPVADAMEAAAATIRRTAADARAKAGSEALTTYAIAQRLATHPETAHLSALVENMRRTLSLSSRFRIRRLKKAAQQPAPPTTTPTTTGTTAPVTPVPHP